MLYVVPTPIGNLGDITMRSLEVLSSCDAIAAEDTRHTLKLLTHFNIKKPVISYFEHNKISRGKELLARLSAGENIAVVSDAGMPGISDPGADLIKLAVENNIEVSVLPGACAGITALVASALPTDKFVFEGFIGTDNKRINLFTDMIKKELRTVIIYEAPHRIVKTLTLLCSHIPQRRIAVCRELTKIHEDIFRGTVAEALAHFENNVPKGEFVIVIKGASEEDVTNICEMSDEDIYNRVRKLRAEGAGRNEALKRVAEECGKTRNDVYDICEKVKRPIDSLQS